MEKKQVEDMVIILERRIARFGDLGKQKPTKRLLGLLASLADAKVLLRSFDKVEKPKKVRKKRARKPEVLAGKSDAERGVPAD